MTISKDYEVTNTDNQWQLTVNGKDYTANIEFVQFREKINQPISWEAVLVGVEPDQTDFNTQNIVRLELGGSKAFKGRITSKDPRSEDAKVELEGLGMAYDLQRRKYPDSSSSPKNWNNVDTTTIVSDIVTSNPANTLNQVGTNTSFDSNADFRMDEEKKISGLNRLAGDYEAEWWVDEDNSNNDQFNIDSQRGGGASVQTYDDTNTTNIDKETDSLKGDLDGVVVKGYGDGDDQVKATSGNVTDGDEVLVYRDKTIMSDSQAQNKANSLDNSRSVSWEVVTINLADPFEVRNLGENVDVVSDDADISTKTQYRIVERSYSVDFRTGVTAELVCNNRPSSFYTETAEIREETKSQTQYMQGNRNTINETEKELADQNNPLKIEFNVPSRFTEDVTNNDRTAQARLDFVVDDYRKSFSGTQTDAINTTQVVKTEVDDFGYAETVRTQRNERNNSNETLGRFIETDSTDAGGSSKIDEAGDIQVAFTETVNTSWTTIVTDAINPDSSVTQGMDAWLWAYNDFFGSTTGNNQIRFRLKNNDSGEYFPTSDGVEGHIYEKQVADDKAATPVIKIHVPENTEFEEYDLEATVDNNDESWNWNWTWVTYDTHSHTISQADQGVDKAQAYMATTQGETIANTNTNQNSDTVGDGDNTVSLDTLSADDVVISTESTTANELSVVLNGNTLSNSPYSLTSGPPYKKEDIDLPLADLNTPGFNTLELVPNNSNDANDTGKALVKGNVIVDHKIDVER